MKKLIRIFFTIVVAFLYLFIKILGDDLGWQIPALLFNGVFIGALYGIWEYKKG